MSKKTEILEEILLERKHVAIPCQKFSEKINILLQKKLLRKLEKLKIRSEIINDECILIIYILYKHILYDIKNPQEFSKNFSVCYFNQCSWHK